ncbi:unnamed protein product, partial [marine sediment metagenome]
MSYKTFLMENLYVNPPTRNKSKRKVSNEQFTIL